MKERPIIFSGPMIRAILDGRKTQFRRAVKPQPPHSCGYIINGKQDAACCYLAEPPPVNSPTVWVPPTPKSKTHLLRCPYGAPGDRLWVREICHISTPRHDGDTGSVEYRADYCDELARGIHWRSPVCMPRWASRITLEIVSVRVKRLNEISERDAHAEGCDYEAMSPDPECSGSALWGPSGFAAIWESTNGPGSWAENPWVWVVEFRQV